MTKQKSIFSRPEVVGIVKRLVTEYQAKRDIPLFYKILAKFPERDFWLSYKPDFLPDSMVYYLSEHGTTTIKSAIDVFKLDIKPDQEYYLETQKTGSDSKTNSKPTTIANLLK